MLGVIVMEDFLVGCTKGNISHIPARRIIPELKDVTDGEIFVWLRMIHWNKTIELNEWETNFMKSMLGDMPYSIKQRAAALKLITKYQCKC